MALRRPSMGLARSPLGVAAALLVLASARLSARPSARQGLLTPAAPCVDARLLVDVLRQQGDGAGSGRRHVLLAYSASATSARWDALCDGALRRLHRAQSFSLQVQAVLDSDDRALHIKVVPHPVDAVVLVLGAQGRQLVVEAWRHARQVLRPYERTTPVLAVVVAGTPADAETALRELQDRKWWQASVAVQTHANEAALQPGQEGGVPVYSSHFLYERNRRCGSRWSPMAVRATWRPSVPGKHGQGDVRLEQLLPPRPEATDLMGCTVYVAPMASPPYVYSSSHDRSAARGLDINLVEFFARSKNVSLRVMPVRRLGNSTWRTSWDDDSLRRLENSSHVDPVELLAIGSADLVVGGLFPSQMRYNSFDLSNMYTADSFHLYLVQRRPVPRWQYPFAVLQAQAWAALGVAVLCLVGTLTWLNRRGASGNALLLWGVLLEGRSMPTWMSTRTTMLIFVWTVFCMHFTAGYRASLATATMGCLTRRGPTTISQAEESVRRVGLIDEAPKAFLQVDGKMKQLLDRFEICRSVENCARMLHTDPYNVALIMSQRTMWLLTPHLFLGSHGKAVVDPIRGSSCTFPVSAMVEKGSPILRALNDAVGKTQEGGLVARWVDDVQSSIDMTVKNIQRPLHSGPESLGMVRVVGPFAALAAGLAAAGVAFLAELACRRGMEAAGIRPDDPPDDGEHRDAAVDAPLQAIKAEAEADRAGAVLLGGGEEGAGRYDRAACLETEVMSAVAQDASEPARPRRATARPDGLTA